MEAIEKMEEVEFRERPQLCERISIEVIVVRALDSIVAIRAITPEDAAAAAVLSDQLGYQTSAEEMRRRIERLGEQSGQAVLVACIDEEVIGWIEVALCLHLQSEPHAVVGGLVVREDMRSRGIGRQLLVAGEQWSRNQGMHVVRVRSQIARSDAHRFYLREGYKQVKTSAVFEKPV